MAEKLLTPKAVAEWLGGRKGKRQSVELDTLCLQGDRRMTAHHDAKSAPCRQLDIRPEVKSWIDNVVVPALTEEWEKHSPRRLKA